MGKNTNRRRKTTRTQSGDDPQLDLVAQRNRAARIWADADPSLVVVAAGSGPGQEALTSAAGKLAGDRKESASRYADHLRSLATWVAGDVLDFVKGDEAVVLKDGLSQFVVQKLDTAPAGDGLTALAVVHAAQPEPVSKRPNPILPKVPVSAPGPERARGEGLLLGGLIPKDPPATLPLFPDAVAPRLRVPLLELADAVGVPAMMRGRGAPLDLRLVVEGVLSVEHRLRTGNRSVAVAWTVEELIAGLGLNGLRGGMPAAWRRAYTALERANDLWIPADDKGGRWWLMRLRRAPGPDVKPAPTDPVVVEVWLPPGSANGPAIDRAELRRVGRTDGAQYRAMLAGHSLAWRPGLTRIPIRRKGGKTFTVWSGVEEQYPVITVADRRRLISQRHELKRMNKEANAAWLGAPGLEVVDMEAVDEDGRRGWRVVPTVAAEAIRKRRGG